MYTKVTDLTIYPVKSMQGVHLDLSPVSQSGLQYDRNLMLVDENNVFINQMKVPKLALIETKLAEKKLSFKAPGISPLNMSLDIFNDEITQVKIWRDHCKAFVADEISNQWFSQFLGRKVKLVHLDERSPRALDPNFSKGEETITFADDFPLLMTSITSLNDLNSRLDEPVTMDSFRPNVVIEGIKPYEEDHWKEVKIGEVIFDVATFCRRCPIVSVDLKTGTKRKNGEPLKTLMKYRKGKDGIYFGMYLIPRTKGVLKVGQDIELLS